MSSGFQHISVCICTFRRPAMLKRLLGEVAKQHTGGQFSFSVVVVDNDEEKSALSVVEEFQASHSIEAVYCVERQKNIALARNRAITHARGEYVAFIDDDEFPVPDWLWHMLKTCIDRGVSGVLGPVRPHFDEPPPRWIVAGGFCERPEHLTGRVMDWEESRTGNVLFLRRILDVLEYPFNPEFGNGGEDKDFFMRLTQRGHVFCWCNEGVTYETVPPARWKRTYMLKRALLRGKNVLKHPTGRVRILAISAVAVPVYSLVLLPTLVLGQKWFMKYCIKLCDHLGRLLAFVGINPVNER